MGARIKRAPKHCCTCKAAPVYLYGRCSHCFRAMDKSLYQKLKGMTRAQRKVEFERATAHPETPRWQYENPQGEAELAEQAKTLEVQNKCVTN